MNRPLVRYILSLAVGFSLSAMNATAATSQPSSSRAFPSKASHNLSASFFSGRYKINCVKSPEGCGCASSAKSNTFSKKVFHAQAVIGASSLDATLDTTNPPVELLVEGESCFYAAQNLRPIYWESDLCPDPAADTKVPLRPLPELLAQGSTESAKIPVGNLFPTFYNIADEAFHPGPKTEALYEAVSGKLIAYISKSFRDDLDIEGTGRLLDGRVLNVANYVNGIWDYKILPSDAFGVGILNHNLHPYRSVAIDFKYLCEQSGLDNCDASVTEIRKRLIGALLFIPRLRGIALANGQIHDGYVCAQDIGGAIQQDRIDIFVGPLGGGNPYLKECRQRNSIIDAGVQSLIPSDWRTYENNGTDDLGKPRFKRVKETEYRTYAPQKALEVFLVKNAFCKP